MTDSQLSAGQFIRMHKLEEEKSSVWTGYTLWLNNVLHGNWGISFAYQQPVNLLIKERLLPTLNLTLIIAALKWLAALCGALYVSENPQKIQSRLIIFLSRISLAVPDFFLASLIVWLSVYFPVLTNYFFLSAVLTAVFGGFGQLFHVLKSHFIQLRTQPFIMSLNVQGFSNKQKFQRLLKHAYPLCISILAYDLPGFFSGAVVVSIVFNLATLGPFFLTAIMQHDTNLIMAVVTILSCIVQIGQLLADGALFAASTNGEK